MNKRITTLILLSTPLLPPAAALFFDPPENHVTVTNHPLGDWVEPADVDVIMADPACTSLCPDRRRPYAPAANEETDPQKTGTRKTKKCSRRAKKGRLFCPPVVDPWTPEQELELRNIYDAVSTELSQHKETVFQEIKIWKELMETRFLAISRNGFRASVEELISDASRVPIAITDLASSAPNSVVVTNGDLSFGNGRRRIPGPNANCAWISWCGQQQMFVYGGNGGGFCNGCHAKYGQRCKSKIMGISIYSTRHLVAGMAVNWKKPEDNGVYENNNDFDPMRSVLCGSTNGWQMSGKWNWAGMTPEPHFEIHDPHYEDFSQWDCIRAVTGHAGAMLDGIQFWGYKKMSWGYDNRRTQYYGGYGGTYFEANAPTGKCLTGIMFMTGSYVDKLYLNFGGYW